MNNKRYKPLVDKLFWIIFIPTIALLIPLTVLAVFAPASLIIIIAVDIFIIYLLISPLFGYVELREKSLFIKYGLILKKEIPYSKIRSVQKDRKFLSESNLSLKNAYDHVNIKYNHFDLTIVSVVDNDDLINEINERLRIKISRK